MNTALQSLDDVVPCIVDLHERKHRFHGTFYKNWDLALFSAFIRNHVPKGAPVLDVGAASNPLLANLADDGYSDLTALDLTFGPHEKPRDDVVRYREGDMLTTPFPDASFSCVTALSVIEHGWQPGRFFSEMARLVAPGGYLLVSTDYWPRKKVTFRRMFGMSWRIFSRRGIKRVIREAARHGFATTGPVALDARRPAVHWDGKAYTFIALAFRRDGHGAVE